MTIEDFCPALGPEGTATYRVVQCPNCRSLSVRWSRLKMRDVIRLIVLRCPVRCHRCFTRFYRWPWEKIGVKQLREE